jgi:hypothetical protein
VLGKVIGDRYRIDPPDRAGRHGGRVLGQGFRHASVTVAIKILRSRKARGRSDASRMEGIILSNVQHRRDRPARWTSAKTLRQGRPYIALDYLEGEVAV